MENLTPYFRDLIYKDIVAAVVESASGFDEAFDGVVNDDGTINPDADAEFTKHLASINLSLLEDEPIANCLFAWVVNERDPRLAQAYTAALTKAVYAQQQTCWTLGCQIASLHVFAIGLTTMQLPWDLADNIWQTNAERCTDANIPPHDMAYAIMDCLNNMGNLVHVTDFLRETAQEIAADTEYWNEHFVG